MFNQKSFVPRLVSVLLISFLIILVVPVGAFTEEAAAPPSQDSVPALLQDILEPPAPPGPEQPSQPGTVEGTGTNFSVTDSQYLNITLDSSQLIKLKLESVPEMVTLELETASEAASTEITLGGFAPFTTYHKYEDDYHNHAAFTTDENGKYTYTQDISQKHIIFIQPKASTIFLSDSGWSKPVGTWDPETKTAVLTQDVNETIQVDSNDIILDGNSHFVTGDDTGNGIYLSSKTGISVKNLNVRNFSYGIVLQNSSNNTLTNNTANFNEETGIYLEGSTNNTVTDNTVNSNVSMGISINVSSNNTLTNNTANSNGSTGIILQGGEGLGPNDNNTLTGNTVSGNGDQGFYISGSYNTTITGNITNLNDDFGIFLNSSSNNTLAGNTANFNEETGIYLEGSTNNTVTDNTVNSNVSMGISINVSSNNTLTNNTANSNGSAGIVLQGGEGFGPNDNNTLTGNTVSGNGDQGFYIFGSYNTTITGNIINSNDDFGIFLHSFNNDNTINNTIADNLISFNGIGIYIFFYSNNKIYNNNFINNTTQASFVGNSTGNTFNDPNPPYGGNYWSNWTTPDADNDGFVDNPYVFTGGQDNLPWATQNGWLNQPPAAEAGGPYVVNEASPVTFDGSASSDPDGTIFSYEWDFDGIGDYDDAIGANPSYAWADDYSGTVGLRITDDRGAQSTDTAQVTVNNVVPETYINSVSQPNSLIILPGNQLKFRGSFFDEGWADTHTASWDFGDGTVIPGSLIEENASPDSSGTLTDTHAYSAPGTYTATLTITDDDGAEGKDTVSVNVLSAFDSITAINAYIQALPDSAFVNNPYQRKNAFNNKLVAVQSLIASGDYEAAINKLENDLLGKFDGFIDEKTDLDWIVDVGAEIELYYSVEALTIYLKTL